MSDPKKFPGPPPDDFSKTTPNIPRADDLSSNDWEKTNYNVKFSPQPPPVDDWGKTMTNIPVPPTPGQPDFGQQLHPSQPASPAPDWGVTQPAIKMPSDDFGGEVPAEGNTQFGATTPYIRLPEAERVKYQNLPPTPTEAAQQKAEAELEQKKEKVPTWFWVTGGIISLFFFVILALLVYYLWALRPTGFEIVVQNFPNNGEVWVDNQTKWGIPDGDGTFRLKGLRAGARHIDIKLDGQTCDSRDIDGEDGEIKTITASCVRIADGNNGNGVKADDDCKIRPALGQFDKAERCANLALDKLPPAPQFTAEQLADALNIFIINFEKSKFDIPQSRMKFLERAAGFIKALPSSTVLEVGGHTDDRNTDEYNQVLSDNRAKAVREALIRFGVRPEALQTRGYGEGSPKVSNDTEENRFYNRRIEYKVIRR